MTNDSVDVIKIVKKLQILTILCEIDNLELLYSIDILDYSKKVGTPIGNHIDRVGQVFYEAA